DCINAEMLPFNFDALGKGSPLANRDYVFTSESVSEGHPDKICDRISDAIVDTFLAAEPEARCGVETLVTTNRVVLAGEVRGPAGETPLLGPDAKSQVTLQYIDGKPVRAAKVVVSIQHSDRIETEEVREIVRPYVVATLPEGWMCQEEHFLVNPTGRFVIGGP